MEKYEGEDTMNYSAHLWLSIAVAIGLGLLIWKLNIVSLTIYSLPMFFTTSIPDIIEPAINPHHRQFFHSKRFFKFLTICLAIILIYSSFTNSNGFFYFFAVLGYQIQMVCDAVTYRGMPN